MTRRGLLALGDSITRGRGGFPALGVHPLSWAQWLAEALELPYLSLAQDGAVIADVAGSQLPRVRGEWDVATLFVGANDARGMSFDGAAFEAGLREVAARLAGCSERLLMVTLPVDLGRPRAGADVVAANAAIRRVAGPLGAVVLDLEDFRGRAVMLPDAVHPTSLGMVHIAERAVDALGLPVVARPSEIANVTLDAGRRRAYVRWYARQLVRDYRRRVVERWEYERSQRG